MKNKRWIIFAISILIVLFLTEDVFEEEILMCDKVGQAFVNNYLVTNSLTIFMSIITFFGSAPAFILFTIFYLLFEKKKENKLYVVSNLVIITIFNQGLKFLIHRPRPEISLIKETGYSFPSGHSMVSMAYYGLLIYLIFHSNYKKTTKKISIFFLTFLIFLIGLSRIYLGVHYVSDVLGGFLFSIAYLMIFTNFIKKRESKIS